MESKKVKLKALNPHISCYVCEGYLIDATTVIECLHTFCRSCLLEHFETNKCCPKCESLVHQSHPSQYVSFDRTMQDIVYKLVPDLQKNEMKRREEFFKERGISYYEGMNDNANEKAVVQEALKAAVASDFHRMDDQVNIWLTCEKEGIRRLKRQWLRCSSHATVTHLKKYLAKKIYCDMHKYRDIDILCNSELMGKDHSLKFISLTRWRAREDPLELHYRKHIEF